MPITQAIPCKLIALTPQKDQLEATCQAFANACDYVWTFGKETGIFQQWELHQACYKHIRTHFQLPANLAIRAIARVATLLKRKETSVSPFVPNQIDFDSRTFLLKESDWSVGLTLVSGREKFHLDINPHHMKVLKGKNPVSATLKRKYKSYYLEIPI
jgi:predicted transposase